MVKVTKANVDMIDASASDSKALATYKAFRRQHSKKALVINKSINTLGR